MIIEVPDVSRGKKLIFEIIKNNSAVFQAPAYYPFGDNMVSVFEKKDIEGKIKSVLNELRVAKYFSSLEKDDAPENFIVLIINRGKFSIILKKDGEISSDLEFNADIQSLVRLYENYKKLPFFYLQNEKIEELISQLSEIYTEEEEFTKIQEDFIDSDYENIQYDDSFLKNLQELKSKLFSKKEKKEKRVIESEKEPFSLKAFISKYKIFFISMISILAFSGISYYGFLEYKKYQEKLAKEERKKERERKLKLNKLNQKADLSQVNINRNKYFLLKEIIEGNKYINFQIGFSEIEGMFLSDFAFEGEKVEFYLGNKKRAKIFFKKDNIVTKQEEIMHEEGKKFLESSLRGDFVDNRGIYVVSKRFTQAELLDFLKKLSFSNSMDYMGFIEKKKNGISVLLNIRGTI